MLGLAVLVAMLFLSIASWRRNAHPKRTALLECMRLLATVLGVALLWQPEWRTTLHPETKPRIAILRDDSGSMNTLDAEMPQELSANKEVVTRSSWVETLLQSKVLADLAADPKNEVIHRTFGTPPEDPIARATAGTDLGQPLEDLLANETNLRAAVLFSDGDWNTGTSPVAAAQKLRLRGVPLYTVPVGSQKRLPDLDLLAVTAPTYGIVGENVQIPFMIRSSLDREVRTTIRLRDEKGTERTKAITLAPNAETYDAIVWKLEREGSSTLELSIPLAEGERIEANNSRKFVISGRQESIRVLVIDTLPRWEYRYLRNALSRDKGVQLDCLLFHPQLGIGQGPHYISEFPSKPEELSRYDVIFIGDVGIGNGQLTKEQAGMIRGLVENQASGVVFLPGPQGNQFTLLDSPLADLLPVVLDDTKKKGETEPNAAPLALTTEGRSSLLTLLADTEDRNPDVWRSLPGFYWHAPTIKSVGGAEVLAVHANRRNQFGRIPLLVTKTAGSGKVLFMGIDSAWRWRRGVEDLYHYRFWGQVARWMSYQRNMAAGQRVRLFYTPERPAPGDTVTLNANAFDSNGAPLQKGSVAVDLIRPDGRTERVELQKNNEAWGAFAGRFRLDLPGEWKLRAQIVGEQDSTVETTLLAQGTELEKTGQPARPEVLDELSRITKGRMLNAGQLQALINEIQTLPEPRPLEFRYPLWSHWGVIATFTLLLGLFWAGRKLLGQF